VHAVHNALPTFGAPLASTFRKCLVEHGVLRHSFTEVNVVASPTSELVDCENRAITATGEEFMRLESSANRARTRVFSQVPRLRRGEPFRIALIDS